MNGSFYKKFSDDSSYYNTASIVDRYAKLVKPEENGSAFIDAVFRKGFIAYQKGIEEGSCSEPDVNMDGVFDEKDYICINLYLEYSYNGTYSTAYGIKLTDDIINNIETNCDYSKNGKSGDLYDIMIVECYSMLKGKIRKTACFFETTVL